MVVWSLVLRCEIEEQLLHVPVEQRIKIGLEKGNVVNLDQNQLRAGRTYLEIKCEDEGLQGVLETTATDIVNTKLAFSKAIQAAYNSKYDQAANQ